MYSTTEEYREVLRHIIQMDPTKYYSDDQFHLEIDADEETMDEFHYDDTAMSVYLDGVYRTTNQHPLFQRMYIASSALMLSTDPEIGLAILFSYDYLGPFYLCYQSYLLDPTKFSETNQFYKSIIDRLEK